MSAQHRAPASIPDGRWRELWNDCLSELGDEATRAQARMLERMILNLMAADNALRLASEEPLVEGSKEQPRENPMFQVASRCDTQARSTARELGLLKRGAAASADDDANPFTEIADELAARRNAA